MRDSTMRDDIEERGAASYAALAFGLGVIGFVLLELTAYFQGPYSLFVRDVVMLALAFGLGSLVTALVSQRVLRWARSWRLLALALPYFTVFALVSGLFYGILLLFFLGRAPASDDVSMALVYTPIFVVTSLIESWALSVPLGLLSLWLLRRARRQRPQRVYDW